MYGSAAAGVCDNEGMLAQHWLLTSTNRLGQGTGGVITRGCAGGIFDC